MTIANLDEYKKKMDAVNEKIITVPSGNEFKIRKIKIKDQVKFGIMNLKKLDMIRLEGETDQDVEKKVSGFTDEQLQILNDRIDNTIITCVIEPKLNKVTIEILSDEDRDFIYKEINSFSERQDLKSFRDTEKNADNLRPDCTKIREITQ